jgi:hypothetical protein
MSPQTPNHSPSTSSALVSLASCGLHQIRQTIRQSQQRMADQAAVRVTRLSKDVDGAVGLNLRQVTPRQNSKTHVSFYLFLARVISDEKAGMRRVPEKIAQTWLLRD